MTQEDVDFINAHVLMCRELKVPDGCGKKGDVCYACPENKDRNAIHAAVFKDGVKMPMSIEECKNITCDSGGESIELKEYQVCRLCNHNQDEMQHFFYEYGQYLTREELIELLWDVHGDIELATERLDASMKEAGISIPKEDVSEVYKGVDYCLVKEEYQIRGGTHAHVLLYDLRTEHK